MVKFLQKFKAKLFPSLNITPKLPIFSDILWNSKAQEFYLLCIFFFRKLLGNLLNKKEEVNEEKGKLEIQDGGCRRLRKFSGISKRMFQNDSCATAPDRKAIFQQEDQKPLERNLQRGEVGLDWFAVSYLLVVWQVCHSIREKHTVIDTQKLSK